MCMIGFYWLWQAIWQIFLFYRLFALSNYDSLFSVYSNLDSYSSSVLVRIIYVVISKSYNILSCINFMDIFGLVGYILLVKKWKISTILIGLKWVWLSIFLCVGLQSNSLNMAILILKILGMGAILFEIAFVVTILYSLVNSIFSCS